MTTHAVGTDRQMQHRLDTLRSRVQLMFLIGGVDKPEMREHLDELHDLQESIADRTLDTLEPDASRA